MKLVLALAVIGVLVRAQLPATACPIPNPLCVDTPPVYVHGMEVVPPIHHCVPV